MNNYHQQQQLQNIISLTVTNIQADLPPYITRLRMWDSYGTYVPIKQVTTLSPSSASSSTVGHLQLQQQGGKQPLQNVINSNNNNNNNVNNSYGGNYYYSPQNPKYGKSIRVNIDNAWNPVDTYIYGPTQSSVFNQENKYGGYFQKNPNGGGSGLVSGVKESFNYIANSRFDKTSRARNRGGGGGAGDRSKTSSSDQDLDMEYIQQINERGSKSKRKLMLEIYDYETPKLCDHTAIGGQKLRPCSPLESYVSTGRDLVSASCLILC